MNPKKSSAKKSTITRAKKAAGKTAIPPGRQQKDLDQAAKFIGEKIDAASSGLIEIGKFIFKKFYGNRDGYFSDTTSNKHVSLRKLAAREDVDMSYSHLRNAVLLAIQEKSLPVESFQQLRSSHKLLLVKVTNLKEKQKLARLSADKQLSVRQLRELLVQGGYITAKPMTRVLQRKPVRGGLLDTLSPLVEFSKLDLSLVFDKKSSVDEIRTAHDAAEKARKALDGLLRTLVKRLKGSQD
jgi:hypothetical protein